MISTHRLVILAIFAILSTPTTALHPELPKDLVQKQPRVYSADEMACLSRNLYFEARSETPIGQLAVALTTLRRVELEEYPNTICSVVYEYKAFSWTHLLTKDEQRPRDKKVLAQMDKIAKKAVRLYDRYNWKADHYHLNSVRPKWIGDKGMKRVCQMDKHIFYQRYKLPGEPGYVPKKKKKKNQKVVLLTPNLRKTAKTNT